MNPAYLAIARLLTEVAPVIFEGDVFALKGGTAINLFLREMPRLSVDLDLVFRDHRLPRAEALAAINAALRAGRERLAKRGFTVRTVSAADMGETKLLVQRDDLLVKVEVNTVIRGTVGPVVTMPLSAAASDALMVDLELPLLSAEEIYGGKLVRCDECSRRPGNPIEPSRRHSIRPWPTPKKRFTPSSRLKRNHFSWRCATATWDSLARRMGSHGSCIFCPCST